MTKLVKPLLRGHFHQAAFFFFLGASSLLLSESGKEKFWPNLIYTAGLLTMFGMSALYHRPMWPPEKRLIMGKLDRCGIFLMIAGSFTPVVINLSEESARAILITIWVVATIGIFFTLVGRDLPKWIASILYVVTGWLILPYAHELRAVLTETQFYLIVAGGVIYSLGALIYALKYPKLYPKYFSYHEVFHLLVIVAAVLHFIVIHQLSLNA